MENASKALLIAAAIIIAIILISLGVYVVRQGQSAMGSINISEHEISAFNSKWESYQGKQLGSSVKSLVTQVNNYNRTVNDDRYVTIDYNTEYNASSATAEFPNSAPTNTGTINSGTTYNITFQYTKAGLISHIGIK